MNDSVGAAGQHALPPDNPVRRWLGPPASRSCRASSSRSPQGAEELGGYAVALAATFGFAWTLLEGAHPRIDLFMGFMPAVVRRILNVLALAAIAVFAVFMAWRGWTTLFESIEYKSLSGTPLMTPLWWPQSLWAIGLAFFALVAVAALAHALWLLVHDRPSLDRFYGARSLAEEIEEERRSLALRSRPGGTVMIDATGAVIGFALMLAMMLLGLPLAAALFLTAALGGLLYLSLPTLMVFGNNTWSVLNDFVLTSIPLFILLGEILLRSGISDRMYNSLGDWVGNWPDGLFHTNIASSGLFAAVSG